MEDLVGESLQQIIITENADQTTMEVEGQSENQEGGFEGTNTQERGKI